MGSTSHPFGHLHHALCASTRVLLVAHKKPDGDTLGSSSSMLNWLMREQKDVTAFCVDQPPAAFRYLDNVHRYTTDPAVFDGAYDVVIVFDAGDVRYCGIDAFLPRLAPGYLLVNIDHHVTNEQYGHLNLVLTDASSTAEIVYRFYEATRVHIDEHMATSLLTGLLTDTSHFSNAATNPRSLEAAGKLLAAGARVNDISRHLLFDKTILSLRVWGVLLSRLHHHRAYDVVTTYVLKRDGLQTDVVEGAANFLHGVIGDTDTILILRELDTGMVKGSFRSVRRDVSKLARLLGGGGHKKAAGFAVAGRITETADGAQIVPA